MRGILLAGALAASAACRAREPASPSPLDDETGRFPHARHASLACLECHPRSDVLAGHPARPGADDHAPCDREACHRAAFVTRPGRFCRTCHDRVAPGVPGGTTSAPYPPAHGRRALASEFSHARHLDRARMEAAVGFHVACSDCHQVTTTGLAPPDHAVCGRCHAPEAVPTGVPDLTQCRRCHVDRPEQPVRRRRFIVGDLRFDHVRHQQDRRGKPISCGECHAGSAAASSTGHHPLPAMTACVRCHDDAERTPPFMRMRECEVCHATMQSNISSIAPRSHLPALERPEDHTRAFRRDHAADARTDPKRCARCHTFMSGSARDTCDDCHRVMRPQDHTVTWPEFDHGPAAVVRADGCATCHQADFCVSCHRFVRPRSHYPALEFNGRGHGVLARVNLRTCVACHVPDTDCNRSGCHAGGAR